MLHEIGGGFLARRLSLPPSLAGYAGIKQWRLLGAVIFNWHGFDPHALKMREVVVVMEKGKGTTSFLDYPTLIDLARSRDIRFVEARGFYTRKGVRF